MHVISIDLGNYSVKILESSVDRRNFTHNRIHEISVDEAAKKHPSNDPSIAEVHLFIVQKYLENLDYEAKIIFQAPIHLTTSRFLDLPTTNRKKAEMMLPFQLEENIPFPLNQAHFAVDYEKNDGSISALVCISSIEKFEEFYKLYDDRNILPNILTTEIGLVHSFSGIKKLTDPHMIIDLGHETTKAYVIINGRVAANHVSHIAGKVLTEVISKTYNIGPEEAKNYKHSNAFFLTKGQYSGVEKDQQEFALLMEKAFSPLILDLKRWLLGYRVEGHQPIQNILLTGGSSNIKNLTTYIASETSIKTDFLDAYDLSHLSHLNFNNEQKNRYLISHLGIMAMAKKSFPINLRTGNYAASSYEDIPLHSATFIGSRVFAFVAIFIAVFLIEGIYLGLEDKKITKKTQLILKDPNLEISAIDRRKIRTRPDFLLRKLNTQKNVLLSQVDDLAEISDIDAISPLVQLSSALSNLKEVVMNKFESSSGRAEASFICTTKAALTKLDESLRSIGLNKPQIQRNITDLTIDLTFSY